MRYQEYINSTLDLNAMEDMLQFRADEGRAGVSSVHMQPERSSFADDSELVYVIERTHCCSAECRTHLHATHLRSVAS